MSVPNQLEWRLAEFRNSGRERQAFDPTSAGAAQNRSLETGPELLFGRVVDSIPYLNTYKVLPERAVSCITCGYAAPGPNGVFGARGVSTIPCGARVWFIWHQDTNYGLILCCEPDFMTNASKALSDFFYLGSRSGLHTDLANSYPFTTNARGLVDFSAGRPFDSTSGGEWGAITETGLRVLLDSFMVQVGCGEACGIFAYLWDQLLRVSGVNLQIRSAWSELELLLDQGETRGVQGISIYPWEAMGRQTPGQATSQNFNAQQTEIDLPWYAATEPQQDDQMPIRRSWEFSGYLGQGGKRLVSAPVRVGVSSYSSPGVHASLFEESVSLSGRYSVRTALGWNAVRRPLMSSLWPTARPESVIAGQSQNADPSLADSIQSYQFSGLPAFGAGPPHIVQGSPGLPVGANLSGSRSSQSTSNGKAGSQSKPNPIIDAVPLRGHSVEDLHAYIFNWEAGLPFHYHQKDWEYTEETAGALGGSLPPIQFNTLKGHANMWLLDAPTGSLNIDHRYNTVKYALSNSYFSLLDDGGVAIGCGFGSQILLTGGSVELTAPGDIWLRSGRNAVVWGGRDAILRGNNCVDISASNKDVRIKAEKHLWALAGNGGGNGLLLLESRATTNEYDFGQGTDGAAPDKVVLGDQVAAGGVAIRAANNNIVTWSNNLYLRTGGGSTGSGDIFLDANKGARNILASAQTLVCYMPAGGARYDAWLTPRSVSAANAFLEGFTYIDSQTAIMGQLSVDGQLNTNDWIYINGGHIATTASDDNKGLVDSIKPFDDLFKSLTDTGKKLFTSLFSSWTSSFKQQWYQDKQAGDDKVITNMQFSFRTGPQYGTFTAGVGTNPGTSSFRLYEDRWQQMARKAGTGGTAWNEPAVVSQGTSTMPYPGNECFLFSGGYLLIETTMFNMATGVSNDRGDPKTPPDYYKTPAYGQPTAATLSDYTVTG